MITAHVLLAIFCATHLQDSIPDFTPAQLMEAKSKGWVLSDKTDEQGIRRRVFIEKKGDQEVRQGYYASWFKSGKPRSILHFKGGEVEGESTTWYDNGKIASKGYLRRNIRNGLWNIWNLGGSKARSGVYKNGIEEGQWQFWFANGNLAAKGSYLAGLQNGKWDFHQPNSEGNEICHV